MNTLARIPRIYSEAHLDAGATICPDKGQCHYLCHVMRLGEGDRARLFNGRDGEWLCSVTRTGKRCELTCDEKLADPAPPPDIDYVFAPLKHARLDYMAQKATEMGARRLRPVFTDHTVPKRVNTERLRANAVEAAEQCNLVYVPEVLEPVRLDRLIEDWPQERRIVHCDESAEVANPIEALKEIPEGPLAILIGPEGGFSDRERRLLHARPFVHRISLGPRIMRADTAAVAAFAMVQSVLGDWR